MSVVWIDGKTRKCVVPASRAKHGEARPKLVHASLDDALEFIATNHRKEADLRNAVVYRCDECGGYHIGHGRTAVA